MFPHVCWMLRGQGRGGIAACSLRISHLPLQPKPTCLGIFSVPIFNCTQTSRNAHPGLWVGSFPWSNLSSSVSGGGGCFDIDWDDWSIQIQEVLPVNPGHLWLWDPIFGSLQPRTEIAKSMLSRAPQIHYALFNCPYVLPSAATTWLCLLEMHGEIAQGRKRCK